MQAIQNVARSHALESPTSRRLPSAPRSCRLEPKLASAHRPVARPSRRHRATALLFLAFCAVAPSALAQLIIEPPTHVLAPPAPPPPAPAKKLLPVGAQIPPAEKTSAASPAAPSASPPLTALTLSSFSSGSGDSGSVRTGTSWVNNVTLQADSLTVGGTARDENGWGATGLTLDASAMNYLLVTARRDPGHTASTLFVQFEDLYLRTDVVSVSTSLFATTALTPVTVPLTGWTVDFGPSHITGWSIGGGGLGTESFRMTFDTLAFTTSAIPEPSTYALMIGLLALTGCTLHRRQK